MAHCGNSGLWNQPICPSVRLPVGRSVGRLTRCTSLSDKKSTGSRTGWRAQSAWNRTSERGTGAQISFLRSKGRSVYTTPISHSARKRTLGHALRLLFVKDSKPKAPLVYYLFDLRTPTQVTPSEINLIGRATLQAATHQFRGGFELKCSWNVILKL